MAVSRSTLETYRQGHFIEARLERVSGIVGSGIAIGCTALAGYGIDLIVESDGLVGTPLATGAAMLAGFGYNSAKSSFRRSRDKYDLVQAIDQEMAPPDNSLVIN